MMQLGENLGEELSFGLELFLGTGNKSIKIDKLDYIKNYTSKEHTQQWNKVGKNTLKSYMW